MASPPGAWKTTQRRGRHLKVWLKQSLTSIRNSEPVFDEEQQQHNHDDAAQDFTDQIICIPQEQEDDNVSTINEDDDMFVCHNIDQAMNALHDGFTEKLLDAGDFQAFVPLPQQYDWILDGHVSFAPEQERSLLLMEELKGPNLDDLFSEKEAVEEDESEDEFGDFQTAEAADADQDEENEAPSDTDDNAASTNSQVAVGACRLQASDESMEKQEESNPGDAAPQQQDKDTNDNVPREIFNAPLHVERSLLDEDQGTLEPPKLQDYETMDDVASPEGRFTRRLFHLDHDDQENLDETDLNLPQHYFVNSDWDATLDALRSIPWEHVPMLNANDDADILLVENYITQRLSQLDASLSMVTSMLLFRAGKQTRILTKGNSVIHEMHHNLSMAHMYVERSQQSVAQARGSEETCTGVAGACLLLQEFDRRDDSLKLQRLLNKICKLLQEETELNECIESFGRNTTIDHELVMKRARQLNETAYEDDDLQRLECLDDLRLRANQVLDVFRNEIERTLCSYIDRLCYNWSICSDSEYERLFRAMFAVHNVHLENGQLETSDIPLSNVVEIWSKCILETLCFQAEKCFARALLDPTDSTDSDYDEELITLGYELKQDSRDTVKLISLTHNLVTIRFDFEASCNYLPTVYHRLCALLTDVLHAHCILAQHHKALRAHNENGMVNTEHLNEIEIAIRAAKIDIWRRCEQVLAKCLDQYHNFAAKKTLFTRDGNDDGTTWMEDLEGLHDVLRLTQQFLSLGHEFLDADQMEAAHVTSLTDYSSKSDLREKLCEAFRKHLRAIHVEAMTSLGASLFNESWRLVPLKVDRTVTEQTSSRSAQDKRQLVQEHLLRAVEGFKIPAVETKARYWQNELSTRTNHDSPVLGTIKSKGNPFLHRAQDPPRTDSAFVDTAHVSLEPCESRNSPQRASSASNDAREKDLWSAICALIDNEHTVVPAISIEALNNVLVKWTSRLLSVMLKLPLVVEDVTKIFRDLCDLYFISAFRLCAGNARNEKIILGLEKAAPVISQQELEQGVRSPRAVHRRESSGFMGFGRRPSNSSMGRGSNGSGRGSGTPVAVPHHVEAELCAPLPSESTDTVQLRDFIVAGQINLENVVKLGKLQNRLKDPTPQSAVDKEFIAELVHTLKKRQATAWSCLLVAALLDVTRRHAEQVLTFSFLNDMLGVNGSQATAEDDEFISLLDSLASYSKTVAQVAPFMVNLSSRIACIHAIMGERIVKEVISVGPGWEESRLNEHSNHYVDETCDRYACIWQSLSSPPSALPRGILEVTWEHICEGGFLSLLDGFSRVPYCSTEGRSLMSMDLTAFSDGIDAASIIHRLEANELANAPPLVSPTRALRYVDMYIKAFYLPEEDVMKWIVSNYRDYQLNHMLALLTCGANDREAEHTDVKKLADSIQALYVDSPRSGEASAQRQE